MDKYNKPRVFLYLDPPHLSSRKKYRNNFTVQDLKDLKGKMDFASWVLPPKSINFRQRDGGNIRFTQ
ncbi:MAG: hypothetical protein LVQ63_06130 [Thermoplasmatales archaeon]|nr:hypothetical protein [Thermoplasmatales archaeon]